MEHTRFIGLDTWIFTKNGFRSQWRRAGARGRWNTSAKLPMILARSASCATVFACLSAARVSPRLCIGALASFRRLERMTAFHMWTAPSSQGYLGSALIRSLASICSACFRART